MTPSPSLSHMPIAPSPSLSPMLIAPSPSLSHMPIAPSLSLSPMPIASSPSSYLSTKCAVDEVSCRRNALSTKCAVDEVFCRRSAVSTKNLSTNCLSTKFCRPTTYLPNTNTKWYWVVLVLLHP